MWTACNTPVCPGKCADERRSVRHLPASTVGVIPRAPRLSPPPRRTGNNVFHRHRAGTQNSSSYTSPISGSQNLQKRTRRKIKGRSDQTKQLPRREHSFSPTVNIRMAASTRPAGAASHPDDPTIRYLAVAGSITGICPRCNLPGPTDKFCFKCNDQEGKLIGTCSFCMDYGPLHSECLSCREGEYEDEEPIGSRDNCGGSGIRRTQCSGCEDQGWTYE